MSLSQAVSKWAVEHDSQLWSTVTAPTPTVMPRLQSMEKGHMKRKHLSLSFSGIVQNLGISLLLRARWPGLDRIAAREARKCGDYSGWPYFLIFRGPFASSKRRVGAWTIKDS